MAEFDAGGEGVKESSQVTGGGIASAVIASPVNEPAGITSPVRRTEYRLLHKQTACVISLIPSGKSNAASFS